MKRLFQAVLVAVAVYPLAAVTTAHAASLGGTWSGAGTIISATGKAERARCRVTYSKVSGSTYRVNAKCASTSGKATQTATVHPTGKNQYTGSFFNAKHNTGGNFNITLRGNSQVVSMTSSIGSATLTLKRR